MVFSVGSFGFCLLGLLFCRVFLFFVILFLSPLLRLRPPPCFLWFLFGLFCVFGSIVPFQLAELSLNPRAIHPSLCLVVDTACTPNFHSAHGLPAILEISLSHRRKKNRIPESRRSQRSQKNIKTINPSPQFSAHFMCCDHQTDYCVARSSTWLYFVIRSTEQYFLSFFVVGSSNWVAWGIL